MNSWNYTITILCTATGIWMFRREWMRRNRHWLLGRWIASAIAVFGLGGLGFVWNKTTGEKISGPAAIRSVNDSTAQNTPGFLDIHWPRILKSGQPLQIQGRYRNAYSFPVKIFLNGFSNALDSVLIPSGQSGKFQLNTIPKQTGKALFQLLVSDQKKILESEPVPLIIQQPDSLNVLILSSYPDFENKFLDQWLTSNRISVVQRTRISKDRYEKNFLNRPTFDFNRVSEDLLKTMDILICDVSALSSLSPAEQNAVRHQVSENGMGLLVRTDSARDKKAFYEAQFPCYRYASINVRQRQLFTTDSSRSMVYPGNKDLIGIRYQSGTQPLVRDLEGQILVSSRLEGDGKIVFSTLNNTFEWSLGGNSMDYGAYWSYLIQQSVKRKKESMRWWQVEKFPHAGEPVHFMVESGDGHPVEPRVGKDAFYLIQRKNIPFEWTGIFWPADKGWQPAIHAADHYFEWYVFDNKDWSGLSVRENPEPQEEAETDKSGKALYFMVFLMSGWFFLWIERKLSLI